MTTKSVPVDIQGTCLCGPYKGYYGRAVFDPDINTFHGDVILVRDVITFQGRKPSELAREFAESVDDYLEMCEANKSEPEKPYSGNFMMRVTPELHRQISLAAQLSEVSMNQYVNHVLEEAVLKSMKVEPRAAADKFKDSKLPGPAEMRQKNIFSEASLRAKTKLPRQVKARRQSPADKRN